MSIGPLAIRALKSIQAAIEEASDRLATTNAWKELKNIRLDHRFGEREKAGKRSARVRVHGPEK